MLSDITAICPSCQDAVVAVPVEQLDVAAEVLVRGLKCTRCGFIIELPVCWAPWWWYVAQK